MSAAAHLQSGDLAGARDALQAQIRANPTDARLRVFLFQLLCLEGQWARAVQQLKTCVTLDPSTEPMARMYREAIVGEVAREKVFRGERPPHFGDAEANWLPVLWDALQKEIRGELEDAQALRAMALRAAPAQTGQANGQPFDWIADADARLGPVLEVITGGQYQWLPFASLAGLKIEAPQDLRDLVWAPATLTYLDGTDAIALIPTRYPGTTEGSDLQKLARATNWTGNGVEATVGIGQRMLCTDAAEIPLLELRDLTFGQGAAMRGARHG